MIPFMIGCRYKFTKLKMSKIANFNMNKPDRAKMRPDCVSACIDHVTCKETDETTE